MTCLLLAGISLPAFSQTLEMRDVTVKYDKTEYPAIEVLIQPGTDEVRDAWEDFLKDKYDVKLRGNGFLANKDVLRAEETNFKAISDKQMDFYSKIVEVDDMIRIAIFASFGYDIQVNRVNYPTEYYAMENVLKTFLQSYLPKYYQGRISDMQSAIKSLESEREKMEKEEKDNRDEIEKLTKRNEDLAKSLSEKRESINEKNLKLRGEEQHFGEVQSKLQMLGGSLPNGK